MNIGINLIPHNHGHTGGLWVYIQGLLATFPNIAKEDNFYVFCKQKHVEGLEKFKLKLIVFADNIAGEQLDQEVNYQIDINQINVIYCPLLTLEPLDCEIPSVVNIPDMQHEYYPTFFSNEVLQWRNQNYMASAHKADGIITLSEASKKDIVKYLAVNDEKVKTIYLALPPWHEDISIKTDAEQQFLKKFAIQSKKYLFYPANPWPHKNHINLIEAFNKIKQKHNDIKLVLTGSYDMYSDEIKQKIGQFKLEKDTVFVGYVKDEQMPILFKNALMLVYPTLFEGFGIPLLESMFYEIPIACSNLPVLKEIALDAVEYFNPQNIDSITESIEKLLADKDYRMSLLTKAKQVIKNYSLATTANETYRFLKQIAENSAQKLKNFDYSDIKVWPKISIIMPTYQYGRFIKRAIDSILDQNYENLEVIVMDGASTDETLDILKSYGDKIQWHSEKDKGQTDAINKGIKLATGEIIAYLNSDDTYVPGSLHYVGAYFTRHKESVFLQGKGRYIDADDRFIKDYYNSATNLTRLYGRCEVCQPACFWRKSLTDKIGLFDMNSDYAMDYEYWLRISSSGFNLDYVPIYLGNSRDHEETKTNSQRLKIYNNIFALNKKYYGTINRDWILGYTITNLPSDENASTKKKLIYHLKVIVNCEKNSWKLNRKILAKDLVSVYIDWINSLLRKYIATTPSHRKLIDFGIRNYKRVRALKRLILSSDPTLYKVTLILQKLFKIKFDQYYHFAFINMYPPRKVEYKEMKLSDQYQKDLSIAIVTPSYNQAGYIAKTIDSILEQDYSKLDYFVQDGLSTDNTVKILQNYENKIKYVTEKDNGQADAINKGFLKVEGDIMGFVNSDDILLPGTLNFVNNFFSNNPDIDLIYGDRIIINEHDQEVGRWVLPPFDYEMIKFIDFIPQETMFWRKSLWDKLPYKIDDSFRFALDWDFVIRMISAGAKIKHVPYFLGAFRYHEQQKTSSQMENLGWNEFQRIRAHTIGKLISRDENHDLNMAYRKKSAIYEWLSVKGIRFN